MAKRPPFVAVLLSQILKKADHRPVAFVLAGHNGSGKSTLWNERLAPTLRVPLINADRLITSILPAPEPKDNGFLVPWAAKLRAASEPRRRIVALWGRRAQRDRVGAGLKIGCAKSANVSHAMMHVTAKRGYDGIMVIQKMNRRAT